MEGKGALLLLLNGVVTKGRSWNVANLKWRANRSELIWLHLKDHYYILDSWTTCNCRLVPGNPPFHPSSVCLPTAQKALACNSRLDSAGPQPQKDFSQRSRASTFKITRIDLMGKCRAAAGPRVINATLLNSHTNRPLNDCRGHYLHWVGNPECNLDEFDSIPSAGTTFKWTNVEVCCAGRPLARGNAFGRLWMRISELNSSNILCK